MRRTGLLVGGLLVLFAIWQGTVPFWGPHFGLTMAGMANAGSTSGMSGMSGMRASTGGMSPFSATYLWRHFLPAGGTLLAGLVLLGRWNSFSLRALGAILGLAAGTWAIIAPSTLAGSGAAQIVSGYAYHYGIGALILATAGFALGRVGRRVPREQTVARPVQVSASRQEQTA